MAGWTARTVANREDVARAIAELTRHDRAGTSALVRAVQTADEAELSPDRSRLLPVVPELAPILPWPGALLRGAMIAAVGSTSLVLTLLAGAMSVGSWAAVVGIPSFGSLAAQEYGVPLDRLGLVPDAGPNWPAVVAALIDGVDMVVVGIDAPEETVRSLRARAREKGCVLVSTRLWPGADLVFERTTVDWLGLQRGRGRLRRQRAGFQVTGRGRASKGQRWEMSFPPAPRNVSEEELARAREMQRVWHELERLRHEPGRTSVPDDRQPASESENDLWANMQPNDPPAALRGLW